MGRTPAGLPRAGLPAALLAAALAHAPACRRPLAPAELEGRLFAVRAESGAVARVSLALTPETQARGLSGVRPEEFADDRGMLFVYAREGPRRFWMPDTHFDLDIVFLDGDLRVVAVERGVPRHPGRAVPPPIAVTGTHRAKYVLEVRSGAPLARGLGRGSRLVWDSEPPLRRIERDARPPR